MEVAPAYGVRELAPAIQTVHSFFVQPSDLNLPKSFSLTPAPTRDLASQAPPKDWPHAPVHRLSENGVYIVTAGTFHKQHLFDSDARRDLLERLLLSQAKAHGWDLEAWAVFANHYHFVARGNPGSTHLRESIQTERRS